MEKKNNKGKSIFLVLKKLFFFEKIDIANIILKLIDFYFVKKMAYFTSASNYNP